MVDTNLPAAQAADYNVGMGALHTTQHQLADISTKPYADIRDSGRPSSGLNRSNHTFLAGQASSAPSSGNSTPLTAKPPAGQFPQSFTNEAHHPIYSDMNARNNSNNNPNILPQLTGGNQFDGNTYEWSSLAHGKDTSGSVPSVFPSAGQSLYQNIIPDNQQGHFKKTMEDSHDEEGDEPVKSLVVSPTKAEQLISFCQLNNSTNPIHTQLRHALTPENIIHFVQQYCQHFYQHFPILHIPTFEPDKTYDGLLLAIVCTGAVYSDQLEIQQVRELARKTGIAIKNASQWFNDASIMDIDDTEEEIVEELYAFVSILCLSLWHGDDLQKLQAMKDLSSCTKLALRLGLNKMVLSSHPNFSFFHQPGFVEHGEQTDFVYSAWLWQEKRLRLMYTIFLTDAVMAFFCNCPPTLDPLQLRIPLPCDDATWDAPDEETCLQSLGFYGTENQSLSNTSGSLRKKQPEMHLALAVLESSGKELAPRTTNIASKFLLIHALLVHLWTVQKSSTLTPRDFPIHDDLDWVVECKHSIDPSPLGRIETATDKWVRAWDCDMSSQYPPGVERIGYSRDGVHYYWLAKLLIQNCDTVNVYSSWNERFQQILKILKYIKTWVSSNQVVRGEGTGSVSLLDERYGLEDLSKDMKLLLAPL